MTRAGDTNTFADRQLRSRMRRAASRGWLPHQRERMEGRGIGLAHKSAKVQSRPQPCVVTERLPCLAMIPSRDLQTVQVIRRHWREPRCDAPLPGHHWKMAADEHTDTLDLLIPPLSLAARRAGKALMKLNETELLAVLGTERGLNELGALPKPRARLPKRAKPIEREQLLLLLPVHDDMADR